MSYGELVVEPPLRICFLMLYCVAVPAAAVLRSYFAEMPIRRALLAGVTEPDHRTNLIHLLPRDLEFLDGLGVRTHVAGALSFSVMADRFEPSSSKLYGMFMLEASTAS